MPSPPETPTLQVRSAPCLSETPGNDNGESRGEPVSATPSSTSTASTRARAQTATIEDFQCPICMDTFINVCETNCSHRFCHHCLLTWFYQRRSQVCPSCRSEIHEVRGLPEMEARIERFVTQRFTDTQKAEREATKRTRQAQEIHRTRHPPEHDPDSDDDDVAFQIHIPLLEMDTDGMEDDYATFVTAVQQDFDNYTATHGTSRVSTVTVENSGQTPIYLNARMHGHAMFVLPTPPSSAETTEPETEGPRRPQPEFLNNAAFQGFEVRLNYFEQKLREAQMAYNLLMNFQLSHDRDGVFVRRIYDRFNSLGLIESQPEQWTNSSPFMQPPASQPPASAYSRLRSETSTAMSSSSAASSRPNTDVPPVFPTTGENHRIALDATGWLSYYHRNRHNGESESPEEYNAWENFITSNPPSDMRPPFRAGSLGIEHSFEPANPPTPVRQMQQSRRSDRRRFSSPNYYSAGYHSFVTPSQTRSDDDPPATGDSFSRGFGGPTRGDTVRSMPEDITFRCHNHRGSFSARVNDEDSEMPDCGHTCGHRCVCHLEPDSDTDMGYDYENNNSAPQTGYDDSQDDDEEGQVHIEIMVRPTAPPRRSP